MFYTGFRDYSTLTAVYSFATDTLKYGEMESKRRKQADQHIMTKI